MSRKLSYEEVKNYIESKGCKLISGEYINNSTKLEIQCSCNKIFKNSFNEFCNKRYYVCPECIKNIKSGKLSLDYNYVKEYIENNSDCILLSDNYKNYSSKLLLRCKCSNEFEVSFANFIKGKISCNLCSNLQRKINKLYSFEKVKGVFNNKGLILDDSQIYENSLHHLLAYTIEGYKIYIKYGNLNKTNNFNPFSKYNPYTIENIQKYLDLNLSGYKIISKKYKNAQEKLEFMCTQGHDFCLSWNQIQQGLKCIVCIGTRSTGEDCIEEYLIKNNIIYQREHKFKNCKYKHLLSFDFVTKNCEKYIAIEYQGEHHYKPIRYGGISEKLAIEKYETQISKDQIKRDYCKANNIKLIEIPYWDYNNIKLILLKELNINNLKECVNQ
ncbi:MAG: hypothetical protein PHT02_00245 [Tissierellia bacterium]|nr:hypothetical protein [Tissierellia bacterium]